MSFFPPKSPIFKMFHDSFRLVSVTDCCMCGCVVAY